MDSAEPQGETHFAYVNSLIGHQIRAARKAAKMTQSDLAQKLGISFQQIQKYESAQNKITVERLCALADIFDMKVEEFVGIIARSAPAQGMNDNGQEGFEVPNANAETRSSGLLSDENFQRLMNIYFRVPESKKHAFLDTLENLADMSR